MKHGILAFILGSLLYLPLMGIAADQDQERSDGREDVYGWELMTDAERAEHRERMRNMHNEEAREAYREEHHQRMQERARELGVDLPDTPMERGQGMHRENDMGPGMGPGMGSGMGPGMGPGMGGGPGRGGQ